uniref:RHS repeat domain-containing protein n=1 Tax=uncultured Chryseobacterium sp. TaxID=259322 RepID=UPI0026099A09
YYYGADGTKRRKEYRYSESSIYIKKTIDYLDGFQYEALTNGIFTMQFVPTSEGYFDFVKNKYIYNYTDHLGNVRLSYTKEDSGIEIIEENNYYPFGLKHEGYNALAGNSSYQYKYQGQELQETGFYSFKWRNYMPDVGRFFNVDPLSEKFPYNSTYAFSENRVIDAIELEGLEAWLIHGTWSDNSTFSKPIYDLAKNIGNGTVYANNWSGENNKFARTQAATALYNDVVNTRYSIMGTSVTNDPVVLIGHSHGGNVAIQAFNMLTEKFQSDVKNGILPEMPEMTLVTVNTPVRSDYQLTDDANKAVDHVNVYADRDSVQLNGGSATNLGGANQTYKSAVNINYKDQISVTDKSGCGVTNHCGTATENAKVWAPQVQSQVEVGRALEKTLKPQ